MFFIPLLSFLVQTPVESDTLNTFDIEEVVVVSSPKETIPLRHQALSVQTFQAIELQRRGVGSAKALSHFVPNVYMPDYGSRLSSACYIRGIGSRINTPAVGLYVDNIPYVDKSSYDFTFQNIERVDVLRGPQGTLYGQNAMGGLLRISTADPMTRKGTDVTAGWTSRTGGRRTAFTTYLHPTRRSGISLNAYYNGENGFYRNATTGRKQDGSDAAGARLRWSWRPVDHVKMDWTASYEHSKEDASPYVLLSTKQPSSDVMTGLIGQNRPSSYRRDIFNTGMTVEHRLPRLILSSVTSYQYLKDRLLMDQDFTARDIFSLEQRQKSHAVTEELALKNRPGSGRWQWTTGVFAMYRHLDTECPVNFYEDGINFLNSQLGGALPKFITLKFTGDGLPFYADMTTPSANIAAYHQSTVQLPLEGLSFTLGARLDYQYMKLDMNSGVRHQVPYHFGIQMGPSMSFKKDFQSSPELNGKTHHDSWKVLPKAALNYKLPEDWGNVYVSATKGYRAGGYNIQAYSDLSQSMLRRSMMTDVKEYSIESITQLPMPEEKKEMILKAMSGVVDQMIPAESSVDELYYKPEYTWSYEAGAHFNLFDRKLLLDVSAFCMSTRDQQLARFAESGMGRIMVNAGRSRSCGAEASLRSRLLDNRLQLLATYGYTHAVFTNYDLGVSPSTGKSVDYTDNRVPFVPEHTFSFAADYTHPLHHTFFKAFHLSGGVQGAGSIYWDEANTDKQNFYATLSARAGLTLAGQVEVEFWGSNLTGTRYSTFEFESMGNRFAQYATPRHFGADVRWHF